MDAKEERKDSRKKKQWVDRYQGRKEGRWDVKEGRKAIATVFNHLDRFLFS